ncbi:UbiH/UbiF/VisC/COQ6 family ubiquinone biosynthesis hydroxylase [Rhizorhapis sp. SPR117]|uniref:UbiH/UbiF/VisC/COQ6 family ubiquinone biosynthesis hydroxylase n=1 Tax=Rhizorhapis sp. SPR117 TaxID=2912611 RepID=UPI001F2F2FF9|nr:UbiH/UbiF/VisC/COQ6 family ubiquinone biosynthesis hydroxylase [Rhizorhapis sp. SPR117]
MPHSDVIILGGGLTGMTLALALDAHGVRCAVVDPVDTQKTIATDFDGRVSAISSSSYRLLEAIGVGQHLSGKGCPIRKIWVSDGLAPGTLDFTPGEDDDPLGIMFENRELRLALQAASRTAKKLDLHIPGRAAHVDRNSDGVRVVLEDGTALSAGLLVAAEGRHSPTRDAAHINAARWTYDEVAIVTAIRHEKPHDNVAYEIFYPDGPFALLPMLPGNRSAIVWTVPKKRAPALLALNERALLAEMQKRIGGFLGEISFAAPRSSYPLGFHHSARVVDTRLALVGDSGHGIHPVAGQGLNLGFRDVAALTEVLVDGMRLGLDPGDAQLLKRYDRWRSLDNLMVAGVSDSTIRLFGLRGKTASAARRLGMSMIGKLPPLKDRIMSEARGESGDRPKLLQGMEL